MMSALDLNLGGHMKKLVALVLIATAVSPVFAKGSHTMSGCGLGYVLFGNADNSRLMQILAATTNGTSGNQTFGITSGTSGCTEDGAVKFVKEAEVFAEVNLDTLRVEMAAGNGEFVRSFAALLGGNTDSLVAFFQTEYTSLFPTSSTTSAEFLAALSQKLAERPELLS